MKKTKTLHRHLHPVHWHANMYLALAVVFLTAVKTGGELVHQLQATQDHHADAYSSVHMHNAETRHAPVLVGFARNVTFSGQ
jgi:hypothetical protein